MKKLAIIFMAAIMALCFTACGATLTNLEAPTEIILEKGETQLIELAQTFSKDNLSPEDTAKALEAASLTWTTSDDSIITVENGTVKAIKSGKAEVTVANKSGDIKVVIPINVIVSPTGIAAPEEIAIDIDSKEANPIGASVLPADATNVKIVYKSSDEKIATVDENGNITAVGKGSCVISSSIEESNSVSQEPVGTVDEAIKAETKVTIKEKETVPAKTTGTTASTNKNQTSGSNAGTQSPATSKPATPPASNPVTPPVAPPVAPPAPVAPEPAPPAPPIITDPGGVIIPGEDLHPGTGGE